MRTFLRPVRTSLGMRLGLSLLAGIGLTTQLQCGGGDGGGGTGEPPNGVTGDVRAIARENTLPGTSAWRIANPETGGEIAAYPDRESYPAGADVRISVTANPPGNFRWQVFRMGSYGGTGGRLYAEGGPHAAPRQADPTFDPVTGLVVAGWPPTFSFPTRRSDGLPWLTGVYLVLLTKEDGRQTTTLFVVRDDTRDAEVGVQLPTATDQAYNNYGGESLYESSHGLSGGMARKVSLDRPIARHLNSGSGTFLSHQQRAVMWLEDHGYDVEYQTSSDTGGANGRIGAHRLFVIIGHEEYGTMAEFNRLQNAIANGTSLAFLTGNTLYWQIRYENNERVIVGYKDNAAEDPMQSTNPNLVTSTFRNPPVNRPENQLVGVMSDASFITQPADWVVTNADHWVYAETGLSNGTRLPGLVFNEWDGLVSNGLTPSGITVLASSVVPNNIPAIPSRHEATIYERGRVFVFAAGSILFSQHINDQPAVAQMVGNLLGRAGATAYMP